MKTWNRTFFVNTYTEQLLISLKFRLKRVTTGLTDTLQWNLRVFLRVSRVKLAKHVQQRKIFRTNAVEINETHIARPIQFFRNSCSFSDTETKASEHTLCTERTWLSSLVWNALYLNSNFWEELIAFFPWYDMEHTVKDAPNNSSFVSCIFVVAVTFLSSRCLAPKGGSHRDTKTDRSDLWSTWLRWVQVPWYTYKFSLFQI
jgi:hypothetical protein